MRAASTLPTDVDGTNEGWLSGGECTHDNDDDGDDITTANTPAHQSAQHH